MVLVVVLVVVWPHFGSVVSSLEQRVIVHCPSVVPQNVGHSQSQARVVVLDEVVVVPPPPDVDDEDVEDVDVGAAVVVGDAVVPASGFAQAQVVVVEVVLEDVPPIGVVVAPVVVGAAVVEVVTSQPNSLVHFLLE